MNRKWIHLVAILAVGLLALSMAGCDKLKARDNLNRGVQAFRNAKYPEAVEKFKTAIELDPSFPTARLYLATAYMNQYIPGAESPENLQMAQAAKDNFLKVLEQEPNNSVAIASLAMLNFQEAQGIADPDKKNAKFDEAKTWYAKLAQVDPANKEAFYSLGVISWAKWYPAIQTARNNLGMKPEEPGPLKDKKVRAELRAKYWGMIDDGIKNLQKSLEIDKNYDDAMAYLNLLHRERADVAESQQEYSQDIATADDWLQKCLAERKRKAGATLTPTGQ